MLVDNLFTAIVDTQKMDERYKFDLVEKRQKNEDSDSELEVSDTEVKELQLLDTKKDKKIGEGEKIKVTIQKIVIE